MLPVLVSGLALGALYAAVALSYNVMYSGTKVLSVNAGHIPMACCLVGAYLVGVLGIHPVLGAVLAVALGGLLGLVTYVVGVRPLLRGDTDQHLWILTTLALATIMQQVAALTWGPEPRPFPRLVPQDYSAGMLDQKFWLPIAVTALIAAAIWHFLHRTLRGKLFLAIAHDPFAAAARGIPVNQMRAISFGLAGAFGGMIGFAAGQLTFAFFAVGMTYSLNGFIALAVGGLGSSRGALVGGLLLGLLTAFSTYLFGSEYQQTITVGLLMLILILKPEGLLGFKEARQV